MSTTATVTVPPDPSTRRLHVVTPDERAGESVDRAEPRDAATLAELTEQVHRLRQDVHAGSPVATAAQHGKRKLTVRERLELLFDDGTFTEIQGFRRHRTNDFGLAEKRPHSDGVITGWGLVHGRKVFVYAHDFRIFGGALGQEHAAKVHRLMDLALRSGCPLVSLNDGAGARIQEGARALDGFGGIFRRNAAASGVIPQLSVMLGPCAGGAAYSPALTDFVLMVRGSSQMFITGPDVVRTVTGEEIDHDGLGGAAVHEARSGVATLAYDTEQECLEDLRYLLSLLPANNQDRAEAVRCTDPVDRRTQALVNLVPADGSRPYDMRAVVEEIVDDGETFELHPSWAPNILCQFARLGGEVVGIVANQPLHLAGVLDIDASEKAARFVQFCDAFNVPLVSLVDVPGFLPGIAQEHDGVIRRGAKLLYAYCSATVPRIQLIVRKAFGGAYIVMDSTSVGADVSLAWPSNEIAVMGAEAAANVVFRKEIAAADDPDRVRAERVADYRDTLMHPLYAAEHGLVDDVIDPADTRKVLIGTLQMLAGKVSRPPVRKHGNPPV